MGRLAASTYAKCRVCGETVHIRYIGENGIVCPTCRRSYKYEQLRMTLREKAIRIVKDVLSVEDGGFYPGQLFSGGDARNMYEHCAFEDGTIIEIERKQYIIMTVKLRNNKITQIPIPIKG